MVQKERVRRGEGKSSIENRSIPEISGHFNFISDHPHYLCHPRSIPFAGFQYRSRIHPSDG
ncbi:MAG: hypothetical protein WD357_02245 [Gracilimonas sp.]